MKLLALVALVLAAHPLTSFAVPIPTPKARTISPKARTISPYVTRFTRTVPHRVRSMVNGLASRMPEVFDTKREDRDDIFLERALEDTVFASVQDVAERRWQRSYIERTDYEPALNP
ncbi:hypothetical protein B0H11DRAFT_1951505 [Mycena galericulata]|nr:hypothetical protein B0H11DRAFT_1951505 [Mycena galericulata]